MANRLAAEISPYLLQHQNNPVHWYAWGEAAFDAARAQNKPILLSVGYATCHWCHVMAHESFEDPATAEVMNKNFINIKVDREERPDIDNLYMNALHLMKRHGGWPLTMFLTPQGQPFFGGTYFPKEPHPQMASFTEVLKHVQDAWHEAADDISNVAFNIQRALDHMAHTEETSQTIDWAEIDASAGRLMVRMDLSGGGMMGAPKFPQPTWWQFLWRVGVRRNKTDYLNMVYTTAEAICQGGIYDHLGGGFARYSTDENWLVPHFEKMLYDNALIIELLTFLYQNNENSLYEKRVEETVEWLKNTMMGEKDDKGQRAFIAALDADTEGVEGATYVWTPRQVKKVLGEEDGKLFCAAYDITEEGNWEGVNVPHLRHAAAQKSDKIDALRKRLLKTRSQRPQPGRDDKILADWNGLMIAALIKAAIVFNKPEWKTLAEQAFGFVVDNLWDKSQFWHVYRAGQPKHKGLLEDYSNMTKAALALYEVTGHKTYLEYAKTWSDAVEKRFADERGGYFQAAYGSDLIARLKTVEDSAIPAGNGIMMQNLSRLWLFTNEPQYQDRAAKLLRAFIGKLDHVEGFMMASFLIGAELLLEHVHVRVVTPDAQSELLREVMTHPNPNIMLEWIKEPVEGFGMLSGKDTVYVCRYGTCEPPRHTFGI